MLAALRLCIMRLVAWSYRLLPTRAQQIARWKHSLLCSHPMKHYLHWLYADSPPYGCTRILPTLHCEQCGAIDFYAHPDAHQDLAYDLACLIAASERTLANLKHFDYNHLAYPSGWEEV